MYAINVPRSRWATIWPAGRLIKVIQMNRVKHMGDVINLVVATLSQRSPGKKAYRRILGGVEICSIYPIHLIYLHIPLYTFIYPQTLPYTLIYLHILENVQYKENEGQHERQKWL